jgi:hypothetical protein
VLPRSLRSFPKDIFDATTEEFSNSPLSTNSSCSYSSIRAECLAPASTRQSSAPAHIPSELLTTTSDELSIPSTAKGVTLSKALRIACIEKIVDCNDAEEGSSINCSNNCFPTAA